MKRRLVQLFDSKDAAQALRSGRPVDVRKDALIERETVSKDAGELAQIAFIISDATADRYGDTVAADGWDFTSYNANRVLLWAHDYGAPPVGKMGEPWKTVGNKIKAVVEKWVSREVSEFAWATEQMVRQGFLNAVSVGFRPSEYSYNDDYSINYIKQELLEVSVVPVPANPNALVAAKSAGLWVPEIDQWISQKLDEKRAGAPFEIAKFAWSVTRAPQVAVPVKVSDVEGDDDAPALPEVVDLRASLEANTRALLENTAAVKSLEAATKQFTEATVKAAPPLRAVTPLPPSPPSPPLDADRIAARALAKVQNPKL